MRQSQKNKTGFLLAALCAMTFCAAAQKTFKYQAALHRVDSDGFYRIGLQPDFIAKSNYGLTDIRLIDGKGNFVPYINSRLGPRTDILQFHAFPQIKDKILSDTGTTFIVEANKNQVTSVLSVRIKNTEVERSMNLSGSDDLKNWYAIKENIPLKGDFLNEDGTSTQTLTIPSVRYHYFKFIVNDKNKNPIKFLQIGNYIHLPINETYFPVSHLPIVKKDSNKVTYIDIKLPDFYRINLLRFNISSPKYYKRTVLVYEFNNNVRQLIDSEEINSNNKNHIRLNLKNDKLELQIINGDNPSLNIKDITTLQENVSIISYLEKDKSYKLLTGDKRAIAQEYDLSFFLDSIHGYVPEIAHEQIAKNEAFEPPGIKAPRHDYTIVIWIAIVIVLMLLTLLTLKMTKEVNKKNNIE